MNELKPCPYCGGEGCIWTGRYEDGIYYHFVRCKKCSIRTVNMPSKQDATEHWNKGIAW